MCAELPTGHGPFFATGLPSELTLPIDPQIHQTLAHDHLQMPVGDPSMLRSIQPPRSTSGTVSHVRTLTPRTYTALYHQMSARLEPVLKIKKISSASSVGLLQGRVCRPLRYNVLPSTSPESTRTLAATTDHIPPPNITVAQTPQPSLDR